MNIESVKGTASGAISWIVQNPAAAAVILVLLISAITGWGSAIVRGRQVDEIFAKMKTAEEVFKTYVEASDAEWKSKLNASHARTVASDKKLAEIRARLAAASAGRIFVPPKSLEETKDRFGKAGFKGEVGK
jgi:hypothetical protein